MHKITKYFSGSSCCKGFLKVLTSIEFLEDLFVLGTTGPIDIKMHQYLSPWCNPVYYLHMTYSNYSIYFSHCNTFDV